VSGQAPSGPRTVLQINDAADGHLHLQAELAARPDATEPVLVGDTVLVGGAGASVTAYAVDTGRVRWTAPDTSLPAAVSGDLAVFDYPDRIEARRAGTGMVVWTRRTGGNLIQSPRSGPLALVDHLGGKPGASKTGARKPGASKPGATGPVALRSRVTLVDPSTGADVWSTVVAGRVDLQSSGVSTRHILATYAADYSGRSTVAALRLSDGRIDWTYPAGPVNSVSAAGEIPAVTVGLDRTRAEALDPKTGKRLWTVTGDEMLDPRLAPFFGQEGAKAFRREPRTGKRLPGEVPTAYGLAAHGDLLVGASGQMLTAVRDGAEAWTAGVADGADPVTYLALDDHIVASVTAVGHNRPRG
jgi:outer membrane protein assembly factor BamB